ncbi:serine/threonine-protein kinase [Polymorphospora sp. NPDC050346]|uniref:serine/threonine-protein kinase n=1 Tax=Polymorphospora sp. NPDC050346 TaxID=3155780 RepID=UPI0033E6E85B
MTWLRMGTALVRRYVLLGPIGRGGVSMVYQAVDAHSAENRAVKVLAPAMADSPRARGNVRREAMITDRLRHPSVPRVYDYGDAPLPDGTLLPYVVLELLSGIPLAVRLAGGPLPWREAVRIAATVADVLAVAHRRGVVHGDVRPDNVMVTRAGIKIIDFGLATSLDTPVPSGPGVARPADDVYALGVLLYEMVTGRSPYPGVRPGGMPAAVRLPALAPTPVLAVPGLPSAIADLCRACMAKRATDRPDSAAVALALCSIPDGGRAPAPAGRWHVPLAGV